MLHLDRRLVRALAESGVSAWCLIYSSVWLCRDWSSAGSQRRSTPQLWGAAAVVGIGRNSEST